MILIYLLFRFGVPWQNEPISVLFLKVSHHSLLGLIWGDEHDLKRGRRVTFLDELRVKITQNWCEAAARRAPFRRKIKSYYFITERRLGVDQLPGFIHQFQASKKLHHDCRFSKAEGFKSKVLFLVWSLFIRKSRFCRKVRSPSMTA